MFMTDHARVPTDPLSDHPPLRVLNDSAPDLLPIGLGQHPAHATVLVVGSVSPIVYTLINCYDRLGSRLSGQVH